MDQSRGGEDHAEKNASTGDKYKGVLVRHPVLFYSFFPKGKRKR